MPLIEAIVLGIVQGLTEFLPISSSGHLVVIQQILGYKESLLAFDIVLHWGTLVAVFCFFCKDLGLMMVESVRCLWDWFRNKDRDDLFSRYPHALLSLLVILATIPTVTVVLFLEETIEHLFQSAWAVAVAWFVMGILLILSKRFQGFRNMKLLNQSDAFFIGLAQGLAIIPGISRSGLTILAGLLFGLDHKTAARFSFLIAIPAILGAGILKFKEGLVFAEDNTQALIGGFISAGIVGYLAIAFLFRIVEKKKFHWFGYYCLAASLLTAFYLWIQP